MTAGPRPPLTSHDQSPHGYGKWKCSTSEGFGPVVASRIAPGIPGATGVDASAMERDRRSTSTPTMFSRTVRGASLATMAPTS